MKFGRYFLGLLLLSHPILSPAQELEEKVEVDLVNVYLTATDSKGNFIKDLRSNELALKENGKIQKITHFTNFTNEDRIPLTVAYLIDISASMTQPKRDIARESIHRLLQKMRPRDRMLLIAFDHRVHQLTGITSERVFLHAALDSLKPGRGGTALIDAVLFAVKKIENEPGRKIVVICSDGEDYHSRNSSENLEKTLNSSDVTVIAIGTAASYTSLFGSKFSGNALKELARKTAGYAYFPKTTNKKEIKEVINSIAEAVTSQYSLAYRPSVKKEGWRKIEIRSSRKGAKLNYRRGYGGMYPGKVKILVEESQTPQEPEAQPPPVVVQQPADLAYEVEVQLAQVAVRITDKRGTPVKGIRKEEIELYEDGKLQEIRYLDEIASVQAESNIEERSPQDATQIPAVSALRNHILFIFDTANSSSLGLQDQKKHLSNWIREIDGDISFSIVRVKPSGDYEMVQTFTSRKDLVLEEIDRLQISGGVGYEQRLFRAEQLSNSSALMGCASMTGPSRGTCLETVGRSTQSQARLLAAEDRARARSTWNSVHTILSRIGHAPGRKNVIFISEGFDPEGFLYLNYAANVLDSYTERYGAARMNQSELEAEVNMGLQFQKSMSEMARFANSCGIHFYWINPRFRTSGGGFSADTNVPVDLERNLLNALDPDSRLKKFAEDTGGASLSSLNMEKVHDRLSSGVLNYYVISYKPGRAIHDNRTHKIEVRQKSGDHIVHYGKEFSDFSLDVRINNELAAAHDFPEASSRMPVRSEISYMKVPEGKYRILIRAGIPYSDLSPQTFNEIVADDVHFSFVITDAKRNVVSDNHRILKLQLAAKDFRSLSDRGSLVQKTYSALLKPGDFSVSIAALDAAAWKTGVTEQRFQLPAPGESCPALAPLMVVTSSTPSNVSSAYLRMTEQGKVLYRQNLYSFSMDRIFPTTGTLEGFYQILHGAQKNEATQCFSYITFALYNEDGRVISQTDEGKINHCTDKKERTVSNYFSIPYRNLAPGAYQLEIAIRDEHDCSSSVRSGIAIR